MRIWIIATAALALAQAARAEDTKPPQISDVKATTRGSQVQVEARITDETGVLSAIVHHRNPGGKVEDAPMVKNDFDDIFKATFAGSADSEYWIEASDLLGNGPATYGSSSKAFAVGGKAAAGAAGGKAIAKAEPTPKEPPPKHHAKATKAPEPPVIEYRKAAAQPPEGSAYTVRVKIRSESPIVAVLKTRPKGAADYSATPLAHADGDNYEAQIPAAMARGTVEYVFAAKNQSGLVTNHGDGDAKTPFVVTFKGAGATPTAQPAVAFLQKPSGPFVFTDNPPARVTPGRSILVRAQVVPATDDGQMPDRVAVLWRGNDAQDQLTDMVPDDTGGWGGFKAELPAQDEGAVFYQVVACDAAATKCGIDTGSKRRWHATAVASQSGGAQPMPLDAVSNRAPPNLPE
jgi:hypothetical protein